MRGCLLSPPAPNPRLCVPYAPAHLLFSASFIAVCFSSNSQRDASAPLIPIANGGRSAANAATCTAMMANQMQIGVPLPGYPTGDIGLIMTLSQTPCANGGCCVGSSCANWAGCVHTTSPARQLCTHVRITLISSRTCSEPTKLPAVWPIKGLHVEL